MKSKQSRTELHRAAVETTHETLSLSFSDVLARSSRPTYLFWQSTLSRLLLSYVPMIDFMSHLDDAPPTIASFGSGSCAHESFLAAAFPSSAVYCHDVTDKYIPAYLRDMVLSKSGNISFRYLDLERDNIGFYRNSFDFVFSIQTLEHIKDYKGFLALLAQSVKPGGYLYLDAPYFHMDESREDPKALEETKLRQWKENEHYYIGFSPTKLAQSSLLEDFAVKLKGYYAYSAGDSAIMSVFRKPVFGKTRGTDSFLIGLGHSMKAALDILDNGADLDEHPYFERPAGAFRLLLQKNDTLSGTGSV